jgi:hypothetical protein
MIHCMVDGREHAVPMGDTDELASVVDALNVELRKDGRFITNLMVDGRELDAETEWYRPRKLQGIRRIDVTTGLCAQLATDALNQCEGQLELLRGTMQQTVELFRSGNDQKGMKYFIELVTGLEWFVSMIGSVGDVAQIDFTTTLMEGSPLSAEVEALNRILLDIIGAQERRDWVLLGDLLEYELEPQMERWREMLDVLRRISAA